MRRVHFRRGTVAGGLMTELLFIGICVITADAVNGDPSFYLVMSLFSFFVWRVASARVTLLREYILVVQPWRTTAIHRSTYRGVRVEQGAVVIDVVEKDVAIFAFSSSLIATLLGDGRRARLLSDLDLWCEGKGVEVLRARAMAPVRGALLAQAAFFLLMGQVVAWSVARPLPL